MQPSERVTIRLPTEQVRQLELLVDLNEFPSLSEAMRQAVRELVDARMDKLRERVKKQRELQALQEEVESLKKYTRK